MKPTLLLSLAAAALLPLTVARAAFDPAIVAEDARWVIHLDLQALRTSTLGQELIATATKAQQDSTGGKFGVDIPKLLETVGTATAYGSNFSKDPNALDGTLILRGNADLRTIVEGLLLQGTISNPQNFTELTDLPFPAYSLQEPNNPSHGGVVVAFPPEPVVLVSKSKAQLLRARDVARGAAPSLAKAANSPLTTLINPVSQAYAFCATAVPADGDFPGDIDGPHARILRMANSLSLAIGETDANTFAHAQLVAADATMADKLMKILQGMAAMLSLAETSDRALADFINSTSVTRQGDTVTLRLAYSSARLLEMAKSMQQAHQPRAAQPGTRQAEITNGRALDEWTAEDVGQAPSAPATRTIENVELKNGATVTLGRALNGGRAVRFTQIEITPSNGVGAPLIFRREMMQHHGALSSFAFPGADGTYTLKVGYLNDGSGKATYAVSIRDPKSE